MDKKKKKTLARRSGRNRMKPETVLRKKQLDKNWIVPLILGPLAALGLVLGGSYLMETMSSQKKTSPKPYTPSTEVKPQPEAKVEPAAEKEKSQGLLARLPQGEVLDRFAGNNKLADAFVQARDDLASGKPPMTVRSQLTSILGQTVGNPGREHVLAALAYASLKTRDGDTALKHLDTLKQEFPGSDYGGMIEAMRLDAGLMKATSRGNSELDEAAVKEILAKAEVLGQEQMDREVQVYARYVAARAYDALNDDEKAVSAYLALADNFPDSEEAPSALASAARALTDAGDNERAVATFERLLKGYPRDKAASGARKTLKELNLLGKPAPELRVEDWVQGGPTPLSSLKGKVVLVNFWQTWCPHCKDELPHLAELYNKYKDKGFVVIGCTKNDKRQDEKQLSDFLMEKPVPFPIARVNPSSSNDYAVTGIPAGALVDRKGIVRYRAHPSTFTPDKIEALLNETYTQENESAEASSLEDK